VNGCHNADTLLITFSLLLCWRQLGAIQDGLKGKETRQHTDCQLSEDKNKYLPKRRVSNTSDVDNNRRVFNDAHNVLKRIL
jgi:hypothetical protein